MSESEQNSNGQDISAIRCRLAKSMEEEQARARMNQLKIQNQWRKVMRIAKVDSLQEDIDILAQTHDRNVDQKDALLHKLDWFLDDAEEQLQTLAQSNLDRNDALLEIQTKTTATLEESFKVKLFEIKAEFETERCRIEAEHGSFLQEINATSLSVHEEFNEQEEFAKAEHEQICEQMRIQSYESLNELGIELSSQIEQVQRRFELAHSIYLKSTKDVTNKFKYLSKKDSDMTRDIKLRTRAISRLEFSAQACSTKMAQHNKLSNSQRSLLVAEQKSIAKCVHRLKANMISHRNYESQRRLELTKDAAKTKELLGSSLKLAEKIRFLAASATKFETEQEKCKPLSTDQVEQEGTEQSHSQFRHFDQKLNKALFEKLIVERERDRLQEEHKVLLRLLKQCIDGESISDGVMGNENNLLIVKKIAHLKANGQQPHGSAAANAYR